MRGLPRDMFSLSLLLIAFYGSTARAADISSDIYARDLMVHFIDVGVGDAALIESPDRKVQILIDGGDARYGDALDYISPYLDDEIELAVITHADFDHWSGVKKVIDSGKKIGELWDPGYDRECKFGGTPSAQDRARDQYLKFIDGVQASLGDTSSPVRSLKRPISASVDTPAYQYGDLKVFVLHADAAPEGPDCPYRINNASIVLRIEYGGVAFLFTGDINGKGRDEPASAPPKYVERELLTGRAASKLRSDVLKVSHHGSETANTLDFINAVAPRYAIISSSVTSAFYLPAPRVVQRYQRARFENGRAIEKVLRTNYGETTFENRRAGDDHIVCGANKTAESLLCDYVWRIEE